MAAATAQLASFETGHGDMVHDAAFDYYGKRLATCSSDRSIKVFEVAGEQVRRPERPQPDLLALSPPTPLPVGPACRWPCLAALHCLQRS